jgi:hypothetical protein
MKTGLHALKEDSLINVVKSLKEVFFMDAMDTVHKSQLLVPFRVRSNAFDTQLNEAPSVSLPAL